MSDVRKTEDSRDRYTEWLLQLRLACTAAGVPLVFDEVHPTRLRSAVDTLGRVVRLLHDQTERIDRGVA